MRPNILLIHSDQHRADCLGCSGHPLVTTPNLDAIAAEGVRFSRAFTPIPLCTPARNCLMHGQWSFRHHRIANFDTEAPRPAPEAAPPFSSLLRSAGYRLGYVGKWHVDPAADPTAYGFDDYVPEHAYTAWRAAQGLPAPTTRNGWFGETDPHIAPDQSRLAWGARSTIELLRRYAAEDIPFLLRWDPSEPHLPNRVPEPYASRYRPEQIAPWAGFDDPLEGKPYIQRQQRRTWGTDDWAWRDWAPVVARYLGEITLLDEQVGRVLRALEESGAASNTMVVYSSDHGDMCGAHGMMDKHFVMYDDVVRVPLLMRWPARIAPGRDYEGFVVNELDLAATMCDAAGIRIPDSYQGTSLLDCLEGRVPPRHDVFSAYHGNQLGLFTQRMVRDERWKYVWNATAEDELYDLATDPGEVRNLARSREHAGELARLRRRLVGWMRETGDPILNPWIQDQLLQGLSH